MRLSPFRTQAGKPASHEQQQPGAPAPVGSGRAGPATFQGLGEEDVYALYKLAPAKPLSEGEPLPPPSGDSPSAVYVVTGGSVDLRALLPEGRVSVAVLTKGQCFEMHSPAEHNGVMYEASAREPATAIELSESLLAHLSSNTRLFVAKQLASTAAKAVATVAALCRDLGRANAELTRSLRAFREQRVAIGRASPIASVVETIPKLPVSTTELMQKLFAPNARSNEIVELIKNDPSLAGLVLKTVNSPYFGLPSKISDYYRAFLFLGTNNVYQLILDAGMRDVLPESPEAQEIQTHSYLVSLFAQEIAAVARMHPQVCTTIGLLHDIGKTVGLLLCARQPDLAPFVRLLEDSQLGASLLKRWAVPEEVYTVIERQHEPEFLPPEGLDVTFRKEISALYVAHLCAELATGQDPVSTSTAYLPAYLALLGLQEPDHVELYHRRLLPRVTKQGARLPRRVRVLLDPEGAQVDELR